MLENLISKIEDNRNAGTLDWAVFGAGVAMFTAALIGALM